MYIVIYLFIYMEDLGASTPPILNWMVSSIPGSSDDENEYEFPFETLSSAVEKLQALVSSEWVEQRSDNFELNPKPSSLFREKSEENKNLKSLCASIKLNMKQIVEETDDRTDYLKEFNSLKKV